MSQKTRMGRRSFFRNSAMSILGAGIAIKKFWPGSVLKAQDQPLRIKSYRVLGRTGFRVSDIGTGSVYDEGLIRAMLDAGVNYIDTAEGYPGHQKIVGNAIKGLDRKTIFITSKLEVKEDTSKEGFVKRARKCLEELQTDYIDCMMMHMPEKLETLRTEGFHQAMQQLKAEGRIRFLGVSHHGSFWFRAPEETMEKILTAAAEDGRFDVFLLAYNFLQMDQGEQVLEVCQEKKIGTALMKSTPVTHYYNLKSRVEQLEKEGKDIHPLYKEGLKRFKDNADKAEQFIKKYDLKNPDEIRKAAIRFVLSNPKVNTVCCSLKTFDEIERILPLSGSKLSHRDREKLAAYKEACGELYCRHACGLCEPQCPHQVPVNTIMRYFNYFESQGREKYAMTKYAAIPGTKADVCPTCEGFCEAACPYGVPIQAMLALAHQQLSLV